LAVLFFVAADRWFAGVHEEFNLAATLRATPPLLYLRAAHLFLNATPVSVPAKATIKIAR
jgi:hypothetical protein